MHSPRKKGTAQEKERKLPGGKEREGPCRIRYGYYLDRGEGSFTSRRKREKKRTAERKEKGAHNGGRGRNRASWQKGSLSSEKHPVKKNPLKAYTF